MNILLVIALTTAVSLCATDNNKYTPQSAQAAPQAFFRPIVPFKTNSSTKKSPALLHRYTPHIPWSPRAQISPHDHLKSKKPQPTRTTDTPKEPSEEYPDFNDHKDSESDANDDDDFDDETLAKQNNWQSINENPTERAVFQHLLKNEQQKIAFLTLSSQERAYVLQLSRKQAIEYFTMTTQQREESKKTSQKT